MNQGDVTILIVRFTQQDGSLFGFDATSGPGYVRHCYIIDHEDNKMLRPYKVVSANSTPATSETPIPEFSVTTLIVLSSIITGFVAYISFKRRQNTDPKQLTTVPFLILAH